MPSVAVAATLPTPTEQRHDPSEINVLAAVILAASVSLAPAAMSDAQLVAARQAAMKEDGKILKGAKTLSGDAAVAAATEILKNFTNFPSLFRPNSITPDSRATAKIWENWGDFTARLNAEKANAQTMLAAAKAGDKKGLRGRHQRAQETLFRLTSDLRESILKTLLIAAVAVGLLSVPAQAASDMTKFDAACPNAGDFLLGQGPAGSDNAKVLTVLCPCLSTGFSAYPQRDVDALTTDLATGDPKQSAATYPGYAELKTRAGGILMSCLNDPAVVDALRAGGRN